MDYVDFLIRCPKVSDLLGEAIYNIRQFSWDYEWNIKEVLINELEKTSFLYEKISPYLINQVNVPEVKTGNKFIKIYFDKECETQNVIFYLHTIHQFLYLLEINGSVSMCFENDKFRVIIETDKEFFTMPSQQTIPLTPNNPYFGNRKAHKILARIIQNGIDGEKPRSWFSVEHVNFAYWVLGWEIAHNKEYESMVLNSHLLTLSNKKDVERLLSWRDVFEEVEN